MSSSFLSPSEEEERAFMRTLNTGPVVVLGLFQFQPGETIHSPGFLPDIRRCLYDMETSFEVSPFTLYTNLDDPSQIILLGGWPSVADHHLYLDGNDERELLARIYRKAKPEWILHINLKPNELNDIRTSRCLVISRHFIVPRPSDARQSFEHALEDVKDELISFIRQHDAPIPAPFEPIIPGPSTSTSLDTAATANVHNLSEIPPPPAPSPPIMSPPTFQANFTSSNPPSLTSSTSTTYSLLPPRLLAHGYRIHEHLSSTNPTQEFILFSNFSSPEQHSEWLQTQAFRRRYEPKLRAWVTGIEVLRGEEIDLGGGGEERGRGEGIQGGMNRFPREEDEDPQEEGSGDTKGRQKRKRDDEEEDGEGMSG